MNRRVFLPLLLAVLTVMAIVPESPSLLVHAQSASLAVNPPSSAADVGSTFSVSVQVNGVTGLIGYDVALGYDNSILSASSANFQGVFAGKNPFVVATGCSDTTGACESAATLLGGATVDVASPTDIFSVTFKVLASTPSNILITKADLAALVSGTVVRVTPTISNGAFNSPPVLSFSAPASTNPRVILLTQIQDGNQNPPAVIHISSVVVSGFITMDSTNVRAGFGAVLFDVIDPQGVDHTLQSNVAFLFPGQSATVTVTFSFLSVHSSSLGTYHIIATLLRCADPSSCVNGATQSGLFFKVNEG